MARSGEPLTLSREDLYELVWSKPMTELAQDFALSDVALAKRCRKLGVPVPGRGYWRAAPKETLSARSPRTPRRKDSLPFGGRQVNTHAALRCKSSWTSRVRAQNRLATSVSNQRSPRNPSDLSIVSS
jgi:hypothetical protein